MGVRGPIGKTAALRRLEGNPSKRPIPAEGEEFFPDAKVAERPRVAPIGRPPKNLPTAALAEWRRIVPVLGSVLTGLDRAAVIAYCRAVARAEAAEVYLDAHGTTYTTPAGRELPRPEVRQADNASRAALRWAAELGLSPASRARLGIDLRAAKREAPNGAARFFR